MAHRSSSVALALMLLLGGRGGAAEVLTAEASANLPDVGPAGANVSRAPSEDAAVPADVTAFRERRDECDHFRGEEPYDAERAAFLNDALARTCTGTDAELKALRTRYARNPGVLALLAGYEDEAE